ncbi:MAG: TonB-dependent receptor domain-containing protein [Pyrinomonadaceae bacterium]
MSLSSKFPIPQGVLAFAFVLTPLSPASLAQQTTGAIKGTVTDQMGSLIISATVLAKDAKGVERKTATNQSGNYEFKALPAGRYDLRVVAPGFTELETKDVEVTSGKGTTLDLQLDLAPLEQSVTVDNKGVSTDSDNNADALILRQSDLEALPNDPAALQAVLQAMAGPSDGEGGSQIKVDGFSNGQMPPKEAIREVRINNNPYSAENEYPGWSGIEIFTQPGSDKFHGGIAFNFNDESLNSRNPFAPRRVPYQQRGLNGNLTGPIVSKRASFSLFMGRYASDDNAVVNATILDPVTLKPVLFNQSFVTPQVSRYISGRLDLKIKKKHTLVSNYEYGDGSQNLQGIGGFQLPSRAFRGNRSSHTLQMTETAVLNEKMVNETRVMLSRRIFRQTADTVQPALNVADAFYGGGSQIGAASNKQDRIEVQNFTSWSVGKHFIKVGGRIREVRIESISPGNFGGSYTFAGGVGPRLDANDQVLPGGGTIELSSLEGYRRTLLFQRAGLSAAQIRSLGGGATQFSIAGGNPQAKVSQRDISLFLQDEWKLRPNLTISPGLRYEDQTNIESLLNFAPRIGFAWSPSWGSPRKPAAPAPKATKNAGDSKAVSGGSPRAGSPPVVVSAAPKPAAPDTKNPGDAKSVPSGGPQAGSPPGVAGTPAKPAAPPRFKTVMRGGFGVFYNRISEDLILQSRRFNGLNQQQFVVTDPAVLDLFPAVPAINQLTTFAQPQTRRFLGANLAPGAVLRSSFTLEQQLDPNLKVTVTYYHTRTLRTLRTVNINAPLAITGVRPLGQSEGNILESESNGRTVSNSLSVGVNGMIKKVNLWTNYNLNRSRNTDSGTSSAPFDPYDFSNEWSRSPFNARHSLFAGGYYQTKSLISINAMIIANSGRPFDITTGRDTNRDNSFAERPAFATDLTKPGVIVTPFGAFDPNPVAGQKIIPRNFGTGPSFILLNFGLEKIFKFGKAIPPKSPPPGGNVVTTATTATTTVAKGSEKPPAKPPLQRPYSFSMSIYASNVLNRANKANPVGNMASPYFLQSTTTSNNFFFGPGGGGSGANRQITVRLRLSF